MAINLIKDNFLNLPLVDLNRTRIPDQIIKEYKDTNAAIHICTINAEIAYAYINNSSSSLYKNIDYYIPDGIGISLVSKMIFGSTCPKLAGIELAESFVEASRKQSLRIGMYGASKDVINLSCANLKAKYPGCNICAKVDGYSGSEGIKKFKHLCTKYKADVILVACGHPLQDEIISELRQDIRGIFIGVGGSFDVWSGQKKRSPLFLQHLGLEWLYRILQDPSPKRIARSLTLFLFLIASIKIKILNYFSNR